MPRFNDVEDLLGSALGKSPRSSPPEIETRFGGTRRVRDGGAGIRLNFPGTRFRPITWDEGFEHFERHGLVFVYEEAIAEVLTPSGKRAVVVKGTIATTGTRRSAN